MEKLIEKISILIQENSTRYVYENDAKIIAIKILELPEIKSIQAEAKVKVNFAEIKKEFVKTFSNKTYNNANELFGELWKWFEQTLKEVSKISA